MGSTLTSLTNGPLAGFDAAALVAWRVAWTGTVRCDAPPARAFELAGAACAAAAPRVFRVVRAPPVGLGTPPDGVTCPPVDRTAEVGRLVADLDVAPGDPELDVALGEEVERGESPVGVCLAGVGRGGALTDGVEIPGVVTGGVPTGGVITGPAVTDGTVADGTVTDGALTVGTLMVGTDAVGTLIVAPDAAEDATGTSSTPHATSAASRPRRTASRTSQRSPPDRSATKGLDIANRLRTGPLIIVPRAQDLRLPHPPRHRARFPVAKLANGETRS